VIFLFSYLKNIFRRIKYDSIRTSNDALRKLGRWATFGEICEKLDFKQWGTDTPKNSVYMYLTYYYITKKLKKILLKVKKRVISPII